MERSFGRVVNLSVSGAGIIAPFEPDLRNGSLLRIQIDGYKGTVAVHRMERTEDDGLWYYGVSFVDFPPKFTDAIYARLDAFSERGLESMWNQAT